MRYANHGDLVTSRLNNNYKLLFVFMFINGAVIIALYYLRINVCQEVSLKLL